MRFLSATKAIKALNEITENEEDRNFETIISADFNRIAVTNTMISNATERDLIKELKKIKSTIKPNYTTTTEIQNKERIS